jgi:hypothetical protein
MGRACAPKRYSAQARIKSEKADFKIINLETAVQPPNTPNNAEKTKHYVQK